MQQAWLITETYLMANSLKIVIYAVRGKKMWLCNWKVMEMLWVPSLNITAITKMQLQALVNNRHSLDGV